MQRKDLALRVLSTAAIMSIVTSIAAPAFADIYYIGNGSIDVETITSTDGKQYVKVTQGGTTYEDKSNEIVIKDGTSEADTTLTEAKRAEGTRANPAVAPAAGAATQEQEAAGSADAAGESQPDPDAAFTLSEAEEDSEEGKDPTDNPTENPTDDPTEPPKKDVVYEYAPAADPDSEQQATKPTLSVSATPAAETPEVTLDDAPATTAPAEGSAKKPTTNVIKVVNNWVGKAAKELKIRLSNVNIKVGNSVDKAAMDVSGDGTTKVELDGQNVLDSYRTQYPARYQAGLRKQGEGTLIITDETDDTGNKITTPKSNDSGSLIAKGAGGNGAAGIGGSAAEGTKNITIEGYATVHAVGGENGAGIGGGGYYGKEKPGDAENIIIQGYATVDAESSGGGAGIGGGYAGNAKNIIIRGHSKVKATACNGAAIGGGSAGWGSYYGGSAKGIVICDYATVAARSETGNGAAIGAAAGDNGKDTEAEVTIGTAGATAEQEDVHVTASGFCGSAIGNGAKDTKVTIQGHSTIRMESIRGNSTAIGSKDGNVEVNIKDNVTIDAKDEGTSIRYEGGGSGIGGEDIRGDSNRKVVVNIDGGTNGKVKIGDYVQIFGKYGAISATEVNIGNNVLLKMKPWKLPEYDKYINVKGAEAAVGTRNNPAAGGLVNTIGDNTELWYYSKGLLQKIVHGKNVCTKKEIGRKDATCTEDGWVKYECTYESDRYATAREHTDQWTETIPATGHRWGEWVEDTAAGTRTRECSVCHATETEPLPSDTNSALELRVVDAEGMDQPFTVSQSGTLRTYTGAYDTATLTGDLDTLRYLQEHGAQTIQFVTNGQTSSFDINDLLAQGSGSEVFYLTHRGAEEPTLLLVEADHSDLVKD